MDLHETNDFVKKICYDIKNIFSKNGCQEIDHFKLSEVSKGNQKYVEVSFSIKIK